MRLQATPRTFHSILTALLLRMLVLAALILLSPFTIATEPVLDLFGFNLESSEHELRTWLEREGFEPTSTSMPRASAFLRETPLAGQGIGFAPASEGLDMLFVNQSGITISPAEVISRLEAIYGQASERQPTERGIRLTWELTPPSKSGQMTWLVQRRFVGVELTSNAYLAAPEAEPASEGFQVWTLISEWWLPALYSLGCGVALLLVFRALPARARRYTRDIIGAVLYPVLGALEFLGTRFFALLFGIILIPLFVISGCTAMVAATEQGTSWWWVLPWIVGVILALESQDADEFRFVILANLVFAATLAGVFLQMYLGW
jgi:hypothetical protein